MASQYIFSGKTGGEEDAVNKKKELFLEAGGLIVQLVKLAVLIAAFVCLLNQ